MAPEHIIQELERYRDELSKIMDRFNRSSSGYHIHREDDPRFRAFVIEIIDLINDAFGKNQYSPLINQIFNEGISNYVGSPSYKSVEDIVSVIIAVITRLKRNPEFFKQKETSIESPKTTIEYPDKITLKWLWEHVPARYLWSLILVLFFFFSLGIIFSQTKLYKSLTEKATAIIKINKNIAPIKE